MSDSSSAAAPGRDFIRAIVEQHLAEGRYDTVVTRFPPEPNGFLHMGHAKAITLNFGIAEEHGGRYHLRYDDTNPLSEKESYAASMREDVAWLGWDWGEHLYYASDYFERLWGFAVTLIEKGSAYVDSQSEEQIRAHRGSLTEPGTPSPYRDRTVEENLDLFRRMRAGEFPDGAHVLRAKIDMAHPNMVMRDPVLYRILHATHYRTGDAWCVYPLYDFAHCLEDAIEGVTHSLCSIEFENNREIYDWILEEVGFTEPRPHQYEFARLELDYTVLSKRKLLPLVREGLLDGWDDPRLSTIAAVRRRGVPPGAVRRFVEGVGVTKARTRIEVARLEHAVRDTLNPVAPRVMCVLRPLKVVITSWGEGGRVETLDAPYFPRDVGREGSRPVPFAREILVESTDFAMDPPRGWKRLSPGASVRLRHAYVITVDEVVTDDAGEVVELRCTHHPGSLGDNPEGVKVAGVVHWVSAAHGIPCEVRLYDRLFRTPDPEDVPEGDDFLSNLNPESLVTLDGAVVEPSVAADPPDTRYQFERTGYFWRDPGPSPMVAAAAREEAIEDGAEAPPVMPAPDPGRPVFNRIVSLRDTWERRARETGDAAASPSVEGGVPGGGDGAGRGAPAGPESRVSDERREARAADPELAARYARYQDELGLSLDDADVLTGSREVSDLYEAAVAEEGDPGAVAAWVVNEVMRELKDRSVGELPFGGAALGRLVAMVEAGRVSRVAAKEVFAEMVASGADPEAVVRERGLEKVDDPSLLEPAVAGVLDAWPDKVAEYRGGKTGLLGFFVGQVMKATGGSADPKLVKEMLASKLESA